ncbi:hypothetical protein FNF27_07208 [Cafeteria roenbergensis]|uniref:SPX domain-containing protein n=1 Tax=Cafeteria roenbergensis TaxID=33653 RepID=A0A5A8DVQ4_CAFRO|nr:hypothetical protein FNF27_07208 [Cafeteria roenbergensis]
MKFGAFLEANKFPRWASRHVEYGYLRRLTDEAKSYGSSSRTGNILEAAREESGEPAQRFVGALESELQKVETFVKTKLDELSGRASLLTRNLARAKELVSRSGDREDEAERLRQALHSLRTEAGAVLATTVRLDGYIRLNAVALDKAAKKFDKVTGQSMRDWIRAKLSTPTSFLHADLDSLLVPMSNIFHRLRVLLGGDDDEEDSAAASAPAAAGDAAAAKPAAAAAAAGKPDDGKTGSDGKPAVWEPPSSFSRDTRKYWVAPGDVTIVKALLVRHLPVLVFGVDTTSDSIISPADRHKALATRDSGLITSIYLDSLDLNSYRTRLRKEEGAKLLRVRWYGDQDFPKAEQPCFMEQKTHHESWVDAKSVKERFTLRGRMIAPFLKGSNEAVEAHQRSLFAAGAISAKDRDEQIALSKEIGGTIEAHKLGPMIRTRYRRTAFQLPDTNRVRVSLDTDLAVFLDGEAADGSWARKDYGKTRIPTNLADHVGKHGDRFLFPMAVMEIKLSGVDVDPAWLAHLKGSGLLHECGKFSKFASGVALLQPTRTPFLPHWFADDGTMAGLPSSADAASMGLPSYMGAISEEAEAAAVAAAAETEGAADGAEVAAAPRTRRAHLHGQMDWDGFGSDSDDDARVLLPAPSAAAGGRPSHVASLERLFKEDEAANPPTMPPVALAPRPLAAVPPAAVDTSVVAHREAGLATAMPKKAPAAAASAPGKGVEMTAAGAGTSKATAAPGVLPPGCCNMCGCDVNWESADAKRRLVPVKVEPKSILALERTLIQWVSASLFLMSFSAVLLPMGGAAELMSYILTPTAMFFLVYALWIYLARSRAMKERRGDFQYELKSGPCILVSVLLVVLVLSFVDSIVPFLGFGTSATLIVGGNTVQSAPQSPLITSEAGVCTPVIGSLSLLYAPASAPAPGSTAAAAATSLTAPSTAAIDAVARVAVVGSPFAIGIATLNSDGTGLATPGVWEALVDPAAAGLARISSLTPVQAAAADARVGTARMLATLADGSIYGTVASNPASSNSTPSWTLTTSGVDMTSVIGDANAVLVPGTPSTTVRGVAAVDPRAAAVACGSTLVDLAVTTDDVVVSVSVPASSLWPSDCPATGSLPAPVATGAVSIHREVLASSHARSVIDRFSLESSSSSANSKPATVWRIVGLSRNSAGRLSLGLVATTLSKGNVVVDLNRLTLQTEQAASVAGGTPFLQAAGSTGTGADTVAFAGTSASVWSVTRTSTGAYPACANN